MEKSDKWWKSDQRSEKIYTNILENKISEESNSDEHINSRKDLINLKINLMMNPIKMNE